MTGGTDRDAERELLRAQKELILYRSLFQQIHDGCALLETLFDQHGSLLDCRFLEANSAFASHTGHSSKEISGRSIHEIVPGPDWVRVCGEAVRTGKHQKIRYTDPAGRCLEGVVYRPTDDRVAIRLTAKSLLKAERKRAESSARREHAFRTLAENSPDVVVRFDRQLRRVYANPAIERFIGRARSEVIGKTNAELGLPDELAHYLDEQLRKALATAQPQQFEARLTGPDGDRILDSHLVPECNEAGEVETVLAISRDVTERKHYADGLDLLSSTAQKLLQPLTQPEIYRFVAKRIYTLAEGAMVLFSEFDFPNRKTILRELVYTNGERAAVQKVLGRDPVGLEFDFPEAVRERFIPGGFERLKGGLCELAFDQLPKTLCERLEEALHVRDVLAMACSVEQDILGTVAILSHSRSELRNRHLIESIVSQAALALRRRQTEDDLQAERSFVEAVLDTEGAMVAVLDKNYRIRRLNRAYYEATRIPTESMIGRPFLEIMDSTSAQEVLRQLRALFSGGETEEYDSQVTVSGGGERNVRWRNTALRDEKGDIEHVIAAGIDITERIAAEERIRRLNQELTARAGDLEHANRELEAFSYSVSHDLRRPLRAMIGLSEILKEDYVEKLDVQGGQVIEQIITAGQKMNRMIDDIFQLAKVSRQELKFEPLDLTEMVHSILTELQSLPPQRAVELDIHPTDPIEADAGLIYIALSNLVGNAWKYTRKTTAARIEFGSRYENGAQIFFVRDNGPGFDMKHAHKLFRPFERLHSEQEFEGTGVGLATVSRIISRHGGRVWAEAEPGRGAAFYFTIGNTADIT